MCFNPPSRTKITLLSLAVLLLLSTAEALDRRELLGAKNNKKNGKKTHALNPRPSFPPGDARGKFEDFKRKFGRSYASPEEEAKRYAEFMKVEQLCVPVAESMRPAPATCQTTRGSSGGALRPDANFPLNPSPRRLQDLLNSTDGKAQFGCVVSSFVLDWLFCPIVARRRSWRAPASLTRTHAALPPSSLRHNHFSDRTHEERQALNGVTSPSSPPPAPLGRRALSAAEDAASAEVVAAAGVGRDLLQTYPATVDWSSALPGGASASFFSRDSPPSRHSSVSIRPQYTLPNTPPPPPRARSLVPSACRSSQATSRR